MTKQPDDRDEAWFESLYREQVTRVWGYAARRVPDPDDVVAEVFITAWHHRHRIPDPPTGWLLRTAHHHVLHAHRAITRQARLTERVASASSTATEDPADAVTARLDADDRVTRALDLLRPTDRELLTLTAWDQLPPGDLAVVLDCTPLAARVRLHRARHRLAAVLDRLDRLDSAPTCNPAASEATP